MKKLIISIVATASLALVAKADGALLNATSFEALGIGKITADNKDAFLTEGGYLYWTGYTADSDLTVTELNEGAKGDVARPKFWADEPDAKALAIDVDTPLVRNITTAKGAGVPQDIGNGLYFDSMVQFTATDMAPTVTDGDKLIVWLKETAAATYALYVTAGVWSESRAERVDYQITNISIDPDSWHRLSIAVKMAEGDIPTFKVYVDGAEAKAGDVADFQSLVFDDNGTLWKQITSVSFQGKGAIDDLVWTTEDPFVAPTKSYTVIVDDSVGSLIGTAQYQIGEADEVSVSLYDGETDETADFALTVPVDATSVTFFLAPGDDYEVEGGTFDNDRWVVTVTLPLPEAGSQITLRIIEKQVEEPEVAKPFTVKIAGVDTPFKTLAAAIAAAGGEEIKLTQAATLTEKLTVAEAAVIDLNGQTLTLANVEGNYAVVIKAALTITDSSDLQTGKVIVPGFNGFGMTAGSLTIDAGSFVGATADYLIGAWDGTVTISGGNFSAAYCVLNLFGNKPKAVISNGTFTVAEKDVTGQWDSGAVFNEDGAEMAISGGRFSTVLDEAFCAEGYIPTTEAVGGYYTVVLGYAVTVEATKATVTGLAAKYAAEATVSFTVAAEEDYEVTSVTMNGTPLTAANGTYSFEMPATAVTIVVTTKETYKEPTVEPDGDETITKPFSDTAKNVIKEQFPAGGVVIKVEVNGDTLKGDAAVEMINEIVEMFSGNPFVVDQGVAKLELVFKVDDVMAIVNGLTGGYTLKAGNATFNTKDYEVVPRWYDIDNKVWDVDAPQDGATKGFFKLKVQKKAN